MHEAKFSVILPAGDMTQAQIETFEETATRNGLAVTLPLRSDAEGNLVVSSGLSLRNAQLLRRQVAGYGFTADVVSDASEKEKKQDAISAGLMPEIPAGKNDWETLELPTSLDLGLSNDDVSNADSGERFGGTGWLNPGEGSEDDSQKTMSLNFDALLMQAASSADDADSDSAKPSLDVAELLRRGMKKDADSAPNGPTTADNGILNLDMSDDSLHDATAPSDGLSLSDILARNLSSDDNEETSDDAKTGAFAAPNALLEMAQGKTVLQDLSALKLSAGDFELLPTGDSASDSMVTADVQKDAAAVKEEIEDGAGNADNARDDASAKDDKADAKADAKVDAAKADDKVDAAKADDKVDAAKKDDDKDAAKKDDDKAGAAKKDDDKADAAKKDAKADAKADDGKGDIAKKDAATAVEEKKGGSGAVIAVVILLILAAAFAVLYFMGKLPF